MQRAFLSTTDFSSITQLLSLAEGKKMIVIIEFLNSHIGKIPVFVKMGLEVC